MYHSQPLTDVTTGYNLNSPLIPPFFAIANTLFGTVFWYIIVAAGLHFSGHWYSEYLPISDSNSYDNTGKLYNVSKILTPEFTLDEDKYKVRYCINISVTFYLPTPRPTLHCFCLRLSLCHMVSLLLQ
jgi:hypothetical protein